MVAVLVAVPFTFPVMGILVHRSPTYWAFIRRMDRVYSIVDFSYLTQIHVHWLLPSAWVAHRTVPYGIWRKNEVFPSFWETIYARI